MEYILILWVVTLFAEEIRQVRNKFYFENISLCLETQHYDFTIFQGWYSHWKPGKMTKTNSVP